MNRRIAEHCYFSDLSCRKRHTPLMTLLVFSKLRLVNFFCPRLYIIFLNLSFWKSRMSLDTNVFDASVYLSVVNSCYNAYIGIKSNSTCYLIIVRCAAIFVDVAIFCIFRICYHLLKRHSIFQNASTLAMFLRITYMITSIIPMRFFAISIFKLFCKTV